MQNISSLSIRHQNWVSHAINSIAVIEITSLFPGYGYDLYCMTSTLDDEFEMAHMNILDTRTGFFLPSCCFASGFFVDNSIFTLSSNDYSNVVTILYDMNQIPLGNEILITINVSSLNASDGNTRRLQSATSNCDTKIISLFPTEVSHKGRSSAELRESAETGDTMTNVFFRSLCPGIFAFNIFVMEVSSASEIIRRQHYQPRLQVFANPMDIPAPIVLSASLVENGEEIDIVFDSDTDMGGFGGRCFSCDFLLHFDKQTSLQCYWQNGRHLRLIMTSVLSLDVGEWVVILGEAIASKYSTSSMVTSTNLTISLRLSNNMKVVIDSPSVISTQSPLCMDLSASSGSGGRPWSSVTISVLGTDNVTAEIVNEFYRNVSMGDRMVSLLPAGYLLPSNIYTFDVELCTAWNLCSWGYHKVKVVDGAYVPITITGSASKTVLRSEAVTIAVLPTLEGGPFLSVSQFLAEFEPSYEIEVIDYSHSNTVLYSDSLFGYFSATFNIPAFSFFANKFYKVKVTLHSGLGFSSSRAESILEVKMAPLVARLSSVGHTSLPSGNFLELNGQQSYDSNKWPRLRFPAAVEGLLFDWTCKVVTSFQVINSSGVSYVPTPDVCVTFIPSEYTSATYPLVHFGSDGFAVGDKIRITLTVTSKSGNDIRQDSSSLFVTIIPATAPVVSIAHTDHIVTAATTDLVIPATISTYHAGVARWAVEDSQDFNILSNPLVEFDILPFHPSMIFHVNLVLWKRQLVGGMSYRFVLTFDDVYDLSSTSVVVTVSRPPRPGLFAVQPGEGEALVTLFLFSTSHWESSQRPLQYAFGYYNKAFAKIYLYYHQDMVSKMSRLPEGQGLGHTLTCFVSVEDKMGAITMLNTTLISNANTLNSSMLTEVLNDELSPEVVRDIMNINCSLSPNCITLNRKNCSDTDHTCGVCLYHFVGVPGSSNTPCIEISNFVSANSTYGNHSKGDNASENTPVEYEDWECFGDSMCEGPTVCVGGSCVEIPQTCTMDCSAHGNCGYIIIQSGERVDSCHVGDDSCMAKCICNAGWSGVSCTTNMEELDSASAYTTEILCDLYDEVKLRGDDVIFADISSWTNQMKFLSQDFAPMPLSVASALCAMSTVDTLLVHSLVTGITLNEMQILLDTLDALLYYESYYNYSSLVLRKHEITERLSQILKNYCDISLSLPSHFVPKISELGHLNFQLENSLSAVSACPHSSQAPQLCVVSFFSIIFDSNLTMLLNEYSLQVTPPVNKSGTITIQQSCPDPPGMVTCFVGEVIRKDLTCMNFNGNGNVTFGIVCSGQSGYNATCSEIDVVGFNCTYLYCTRSLTAANNSIDYFCRCSLGEKAHTVPVYMADVMTAVWRNFCSVLDTTEGKPADESWKILTTILCVVALFGFALYQAHLADKKHFLKNVNKIKNEEEKNKKGVKSSRRVVPLMKTMAPTIVCEVEALFPSFFNQNSFNQIFLTELKESHRWASLLFHYNPCRPRAFRVLVVASLVNCVIFLNSLFFNISHYELDLSCKDKLYQDECEFDKSHFSARDSKCFWDEERLECHFKPPAIIVSAAIAAMVASAVLSIPIVVMLELMLKYGMLHPAIFFMVTPKIRNRVTPVNEEDLESRLDSYRVEVSEFEGNETWLTSERHDKVERSFTELMTAIAEYRSALSDIPKKEFDMRWGFGDVGINMRLDLQHFREKFCSGVTEHPDSGQLSSKPFLLLRKLCLNFTGKENKLKSLPVFSRIMQTIKMAQELADEEVQLIRTLPEIEQRKRLLMLFQKDLLKSMNLGSGMVPNDSVYNADMQSPPSQVEVAICIVCAFLIISLNVFFLVFTLLFATRQTSSGQFAFLRSFLGWLALEIVVISSLTMLISRVLIPLLYYMDVNRIKRVMSKVIHNFRFPSSDVDCERPPDSFFDPPNSAKIVDSKIKPFNKGRVPNVCPHLFVSHRVAKNYPYLPESQAIIGFRSCYPKMSFAEGNKSKSTVVDVGLFKLSVFLNSFNILIVALFGNVLSNEIISMLIWFLFGYAYMLRLRIMQSAYGLVVILLIMLIMIGSVKYALVYIDDFLKRNSFSKKLSKLKKSSIGVDRQESNEKDENFVEPFNYFNNHNIPLYGRKKKDKVDEFSIYVDSDCCDESDSSDDDEQFCTLRHRRMHMSNGINKANDGESSDCSSDESKKENGGDVRSAGGQFSLQEFLRKRIAPDTKDDSDSEENNSRSQDSVNESGNDSRNKDDSSGESTGTDEQFSIYGNYQENVVNDITMESEYDSSSSESSDDSEDESSEEIGSSEYTTSTENEGEWNIFADYSSDESFDDDSSSDTSTDTNEQFSIYGHLQW